MKLVIIILIVLFAFMLHDHHGRSVRIEQAEKTWASLGYQCDYIDDVAKKHDLRYNDIIELKHKHNCK